MKISIWQQFSGNHSADFTVVGTFQSPEKAASVADVLRQMVREIAIFWRDMSEEEHQKWEQGVTDGYGYSDVTPIEQKWSDYFGVEWPKSLGGSYFRIDWVPPDPDKAEKGVVLFGPHVMVSNVELTNSRYSQFVAIFEKYDGVVANGSEVEGLELFVIVRCDAPDEATADQLMADIKDFGSLGGVYEVAGQFMSFYSKRYARSELRDGLSMMYPMNIVDIFGPASTSELQPFKKYLEDHHCTNIRFEFTTFRP